MPEFAVYLIARTRSNQHFETNHLQADLKRRSVHGGVLTLSAQVVKFGLQLGSIAILARLLAPSDFGLMAMVATFTGFVSLFNDLGLTAATVQRDEITHAQVNSLFWVNVAVSLALAGISAALAPVVGWFYGDHRLVWITCVVSGTFVFSGLAAQHYALLVRQMRFREMALVQIGAFALGAAVGVLLAARGIGYWSLVVMGASTSATVAASSWYLSQWRPSWPRHATGLSDMLRFGGALTGSNLSTYVVRNLDNVMIGRACGALLLGLYTKAYGLVLLPIQQIGSPLNGVLLPALSRLQNDPMRFRRYYVQAVGLLGLVSMPLVAFAFADARAVVHTVLGPRWAAAVPLFRMLAPAAFIGTVSVAADWLLISLGQTRRLFKWSLIPASITVLGFSIGIRWGAAGIATVLSLTTCILALPMFWWACKGSPIGLSDLFSALWRTVVASVSAAVFIIILRERGFGEQGRIPFVLALDAFLYASLYLLGFVLLPGGLRFLIETASALGWMRAVPKSPN